MSDTDIEIVADAPADAGPEAAAPVETADEFLAALEAMDAEEEYVDPLIAAGDGLVAAMASGNTGVIQAAVDAWEAAKVDEFAEDDES